MTKYNFWCFNCKDHIKIVLEEDDISAVEHQQTNCPHCKKQLKVVGQEGPGLFADRQTRIKRNHKYFKERARKHGQSEEAKAEKQKHLNRELGKFKQ